MKPNEFLDEIGQIAEAFRRKIELEVEAFDTCVDARSERLNQVNDPLSGFRFFCETYFPHYLEEEASHLHEELFEMLPRALQTKEGVRELLKAPRGSAKSTYISQLFPLYCVMLCKKHYIVLVMDAFEQAAVMLEAIKAELEFNPRLLFDFPEQTGQGREWASGKIITANHIKIEGFGTGKKIRGRRHGPFRPDLAILDDVENDENVESKKQRDKLEKWISKAVLKLGPTDGSMDVFYAGTVIHNDAVINRIAKKKGWNVTEYQAILKWPDRMDLWEQWEELYLNNEDDADMRFYAKNKAEMNKGAKVNWPAMHSLLYLMMERAGDHESFESEYQNKPISKGNPFQDITWWVQKKRDWVYFGALDPSLGRKGSNGDPSAILIGGFDREEGILDVVEASIRRRLPSVIIEDVIAMQREYQCQLWFVENIQFQEFLRTQIMAEAAKAKPPIALPCMPVTPHTDKKLRIERLQAPMKASLIRLHKSQTTLIDQLQQWPTADHDDGPDCLEMLWTHALQYGGTTLTSGGLTIAQGSPQNDSYSDNLGGYEL